MSSNSQFSHSLSSQKLSAEQIRIIYRQLPAAIAPPILAACLISYLMWGYASYSNIILWLVLVCVSYLVGPTTIYWLFRRNKPDDNQVQAWGIWFVIVAVITTSCWGSASFLLFVPDSEIHQLLLFVSLCTGAAAVMVTTASYRPGFYAGVIPMLLPIAVRSAMEGGLFNILVAGMMLLFFAMLVHLHITFYAELIKSLKLQFENKELIEVLRKQNKKIEQDSRVKSQFFAAASHDLRQPIHAQVLFIAELEARNTDKESKKIIGYLKKSMDSMQGLLSALLDKSKLDAGIVIPVIQKFPINDILDALDSEFESLMRQRENKYRVVRCEKYVNSDPVLLERILRNLISNALRNTSAGSVLVGCRWVKGKLRVEVRDSGPGIPEAQQEAIFEEFYQLENSERDIEKGLGLGLAIVEQLARIMGHDVKLKSEPGKGSTFSVDVDVADKQGELDQDRQKLDLVKSELHGTKVLVIDDDVNVCTAMRGLLTKWGCNVIIVSSAEQAISELQFSGWVPQMIISDYRLRDAKTGVQAIELVKDKVSSEVPAILITGDTDPERLKQAKKSNYILLHKPVDPENLLDVMNNVRSQSA